MAKLSPNLESLTMTPTAATADIFLSLYTFAPLTLITETGSLKVVLTRLAPLTIWIQLTVLKSNLY